MGLCPERMVRGEELLSKENGESSCGGEETKSSAVLFQPHV